MEPEEAKDLLGHVVFLDVREPNEWDLGHVEGATHIPIGQITTRVNELDPAQDMVVVCQVGQRSALVTEWLNANGYRARNLDGGLAAWSAQGLPLTAGVQEGTIIDGWTRHESGESLGPEEK